MNQSTSQLKTHLQSATMVQANHRWTATPK